MEDFKNKVIVITGSTKGIGKRTAEVLASRGALIVINSRNVDKVQKTVQEFKIKGYAVFGSAGDVSDFDYCLQLHREVIGHFGKIDFLINNAGIAINGTLNNTNAKTFDQATRINFFGSIYPTKVFLEDLIKNKGGVLFISSLAGIVGLPGYIVYASSKRAVVSIAESLKNELIDQDVFVGVNFPGFTQNDMDKEITSANGTVKILPQRTNVKVDSLDKTVNSIIRQIERKKFREFGSFKGYMIHFIYGISPKISLYVLKLNRRKIMSMD